MIALITGKLVQKQPNQIIVDVGGVGYELTIPLSTYYELGDPGAEVALRVHTHVREDALQLYGFRTEQEKKLFLHLTSVSGIGPKLAITILSGMGADDLVRAIYTGDLARLVGIPGVGKKTAERMLVELKEKMQSLSPTAAEKPAMTAAALTDDIISALVNLGYPKNVAEKAAATAAKEAPDANFSGTLKLALRKLAK